MNNITAIYAYEVAVWTPLDTDKCQVKVNLLWDETRKEVDTASAVNW